MSISANIALIRATLPKGVELLCVSKYHTQEAIMEAYQAGERLFGESRVQELQVKHAALPKDIRWHFIGHLQTNKIKPLLPMVDLIHGVDSLRLLEAINQEAAKLNLPHKVRVLLEVKVAQEESKYGFTREEILEMFKPNNYPLSSIEHRPSSIVTICGIMGMASHTSDKEQIRQEFHALAEVFQQIAPILREQNHEEPILSMGMTDDYPIAVEQGANLVRIGSGVFG